ncbi:hypothetical protein [Mycoplasma sp. OR1901]|uniref:hypothetical protein n=1 Tax=Mycoplasma sp. OR1901 TaxID=2742195 RepID=UPI00158279C9|nr:hypothetical protein [Mycoplasma sp. OR1901]QKT05472.1 hypothetical protein HTZ87_02010 [Mycoplasma sp. OR1901]
MNNKERKEMIETSWVNFILPKKSSLSHNSNKIDKFYEYYSLYKYSNPDFISNLLRDVEYYVMKIFKFLDSNNIKVVDKFKNDLLEWILFRISERWTSKDTSTLEIINMYSTLKSEIQDLALRIPLTMYENFLSDDEIVDINEHNVPLTKEELLDIEKSIEKYGPLEIHYEDNTISYRNEPIIPDKKITYAYRWFLEHYKLNLNMAKSDLNGLYKKLKEINEFGCLDKYLDSNGYLDYKTLFKEQKLYAE